MARYSILYWRDIPSVIEANDGRARHKAQLSDRFQQLIDAVAMREGLAGTDAYLEQWRRGDPVEREGSAVEVANGLKEEIEASYDAIKNKALGRA